MYEDVQTVWQYRHSATNKPEKTRLHRLWRASRDSARTPVQWDSTENAGFTTGKPWFYVNQNYKKINVAQQETDPDSILNFYREAIRLRKSLPVVRHGDYREHFRGSGKLYCYSRSMPGQKILVICSFVGKETGFRVPAGFDISKARLVLQTVKAPGSRLTPYEARIYLWEE